MRGLFCQAGRSVDAVEISALNRSELVLYNQLLAHAWNDIEPGRVYSVRKSSLRNSHESNDRLHDSFDRLMGAFAKVKYRDPETGATKTVRISLLGPNAEEDSDEGCFHYTFDPSVEPYLGPAEVGDHLSAAIEILDPAL